MDCKTYIHSHELRLKTIHQQHSKSYLTEAIKEQFHEKIQNKGADMKENILSNSDPREKWEALRNITKETIEQLQRADSTSQPN